MSRALAERGARFLGARTSRRGFLARVAVVGSAVAAAPVAYLFKPNSAYAALCGPASSCAAGYTAFCCTVSNGVNKCPPGTFVGGWWKADSSSYCCDGGARRARYYIDCQAECTGCGCDGSALCDPKCVDCHCECSGDPCDGRKVCCNYFRYGQCHTEIGCAGPVACRIVTCVPPYALYPSCGSSSATDNATAEHTAACLAGPCA